MDNQEMWKSIQSSLDSLNEKAEDIDDILRGDSGRDGVIPELKAITHRLDDFKEEREKDRSKIIWLEDMVRGKDGSPGILSRMLTVEKWVSKRVWLEKFIVGVIIVELFGLLVVVGEKILGISY